MKNFAMCALITALLVVAGCASSGARRIDPGGTEMVTSLNKIDIQDWMDAADKMIKSLKESAVLAQSDGPVVIAISRIRNNTTQQIDTDMLTKKIRTELNRWTEVEVMTTTVIGLGGNAEDPLAQGEQQRAEFFSDGEDTEVKAVRPQYTLSGKIIEDRARAGSVRQTTYVFQLALTDVRNGLAVWEDEKQITKQGKRNTVGW